MLLKIKSKLVSTIGPDFGFSPAKVVDVEVLKQYIVDRSIKNGSRSKGKISQVSSERGSSGGWFSKKVMGRLCILYTLWIMTFLTHSTELLKCK